MNLRISRHPISNYKPLTMICTKIRRHTSVNKKLSRFDDCRKPTVILVSSSALFLKIWPQEQTPSYFSSHICGNCKTFAQEYETGALSAPFISGHLLLSYFCNCHVFLSGKGDDFRSLSSEEVTNRTRIPTQID